MKWRYDHGTSEKQGQVWSEQGALCEDHIMVGGIGGLKYGYQENDHN